MERKSKGIWIPIELWESKELTMQEKLMLVEIDSLDNDEGCFATNKHFADWFDLSAGRCSQIINSLKEKGYITVDFMFDGKEIKRRTIKSNYKYLKIDTPEMAKKGIKNIKHPLKEIKGVGNEMAKKGIKNIKHPISDIKGGMSDIKDPPLGNDEDNNTLLIIQGNNTKDNNIVAQSEKGIENKELLNALKEFKKHRVALRKKMTDFAYERFIKKLYKDFDNDEERIEAINIAIEKGWLSVEKSWIDNLNKSTKVSARTVEGIQGEWGNFINGNL